MREKFHHIFYVISTKRLLSNHFYYLPIDILPHFYYLPIDILPHFTHVLPTSSLPFFFWESHPLNSFCRSFMLCYKQSSLPASFSLSLLALFFGMVLLRILWIQSEMKLLTFLFSVFINVAMGPMIL